MPNRDVVAIGASAGGVEALGSLLSQLPADLPAALLLVQHLAPGGPSTLHRILGRAGLLPVEEAADGAPVVPGRAYVAVPDHHLLVKDGRLRLSRGPRENRARPAVDPLFRSAAAAYGSRLVGVVLTGLLDDGASGLRAVQRCGGLAVVQDPEDAAFPDMPRSALDAVAPDHVVSLEDLGGLLRRLVREPAGAPVPIPRDVEIETEMSMGNLDEIDAVETLGEPAPLSCPECGGPVWEIREGDGSRYRCRVGHAFTAAAMVTEQDVALERALWVALRTLEDRGRTLNRLAEQETSRGRERTASAYGQRAKEARTDAERVRAVLLRTAKPA